MFATEENHGAYTARHRLVPPMFLFDERVQVCRPFIPSAWNSGVVWVFLSVWPVLTGKCIGVESPTK